MQRKIGANQVRRGMVGVVNSGRFAGGRVFAIAPHPSFMTMGEWRKGHLEIIPEQAEVIREIFERYAKGHTPIEIAADLTARKVPPPRHDGYNQRNYRAPGTLMGNPARGSGILRNQHYAGKIVWGSVRTLKHFETD